MVLLPKLLSRSGTKIPEGAAQQMSDAFASIWLEARPQSPKIYRRPRGYVVETT